VRTVIACAEGVVPADASFAVFRSVCPLCRHSKLVLSRYRVPSSSLDHQVWPTGSSRPPIPAQVPTEFHADYQEAAAILELSPKAAAALARRCLQHLLHAKMGIKKRDLAKEIEAALELPTLPDHVAAFLDGIRTLGNFGAHPIPSEHTGEIVDVEPHEAEWTLDALDLLFEHLFVQPAKAQAKREAMDAKLKKAGKPAMRTRKPRPADNE
jgi:hypothetical protein